MGVHCYCLTPDEGMDAESLKCDSCGLHFHTGCLKSGRPSPLRGDVFFSFICQNCSSTGAEQIKRLHIPWLPVIVLTLYNLQLTGAGKLGYFRWKEQICAFIENHWTVFFGSKKRPVNIGGTVAGALSLWNNVYFKSGSDELHQTGWWKLVDCSPPSIDILTVTRAVRNSLPADPACSDKKTDGKSERLRNKSKKPSIAVAMELKAKRDLSAIDITASNKQRKSFATNVISSSNSADEFCNITTECSPNVSLENSASDGISNYTISEEQSVAGCYDNGDTFYLLPIESSCVELEAFDSVSSSPTNWLTEQNLILDGPMADFMMHEDEEANADVLSDLDSTFVMESELENSELILSPSHLHNSTGAEPLAHLHDILSNMEWSDDRRLEDHNSIENQQDILTWHISNTHEESDTNLNNGTMEDEVEKVKETNYASQQPSCTESSAAGSIADDENFAQNDSSDNESSNDSDSSRAESENKVERKKTSNKRRRKYRKKDEVEKVKEDPGPKLQLMSVYEEKQLLKLLNSYEEFIDPGSAVYRLRCKLRVRQMKRERGLPVFDIDHHMKALLHSTVSSLGDIEAEFHTSPGAGRNVQSSGASGSEYRILDRYQTQSSNSSSYHTNSSQSVEPVSFRSRLMGNDDRIPLIYSPYTTRILKPFIRQDFEIKPQKLQLLEEIVAHSHRNDSTWKRPLPYPVDFCYVRPKLIPAVNALCQQFFWPGINLSDCLQYPDSSCVVLYRQLVIGFAFMVPDVSYNESYISFIFTHPDWRRAGIASFMLYHLIQTTPGKDVTLHVSSSNPALLLYQKFGFKEEEFIIDFYDKYFPADSQECRHAFFMRLRR